VVKEVLIETDVKGGFLAIKKQLKESFTRKYLFYGRGQ
jgi:hypothetical protein